MDLVRKMTTYIIQIAFIYSYQCFCSNSSIGFGIYGLSPNASDCNMTCNGNKKEMCGGNWRNSIYQLGEGMRKLFNSPYPYNFEKSFLLLNNNHFSNFI